MAFCKNCGTMIDDNAAVCPQCGAAQQPQQYAQPQQQYAQPQQQYAQPQQQYAQPQYAAPVAEPDNGGFGWGLLGFCIPLVGLILFLVWKDNKPRTSKAAGKGALISAIIGVAFYIISILFAIMIPSLSSFL